MVVVGACGLRIMSTPAVYAVRSTWARRATFTGGGSDSDFQAVCVFCDFAFIFLIYFLVFIFLDCWNYAPWRIWLRNATLGGDRCGVGSFCDTYEGGLWGFAEEFMGSDEKWNKVKFLMNVKEENK